MVCVVNLSYFRCEFVCECYWFLVDLLWGLVWSIVISGWLECALMQVSAAINVASYSFSFNHFFFVGVWFL